MSSVANRTASDRIVWIDCEMTGLSLEHDALIEVAVIVTDFDLEPLDDGIEVVITPPREALRQMNDFVRQMHTDSGLLAVLEDGMSMDDAQTLVLEYVKRHAPEAGKFPLGGNTVGTDRAFLARDMPDLEGHLHYRNVDVSTIKELARRWYPRVYFNAPPKSGGHRALGDIRDSIAELRYYREDVFVPAPGPDSTEAKQIASRHGTAAGEAAGEAATEQD